MCLAHTLHPYFNANLNQNMAPFDPRSLLMKCFHPSCSIFLPQVIGNKNNALGLRVYVSGLIDDGGGSCLWYRYMLAQFCTHWIDSFRLKLSVIQSVELMSWPMTVLLVQFVCQTLLRSLAPMTCPVGMHQCDQDQRRWTCQNLRRMLYWGQSVGESWDAASQGGMFSACSVEHTASCTRGGRPFNSSCCGRSTRIALYRYTLSFHVTLTSWKKGSSRVIVVPSLIAPSRSAYTERAKQLASLSATK